MIHMRKHIRTNSRCTPCVIEHIMGFEAIFAVLKYHWQHNLMARDGKYLSVH